VLKNKTYNKMRQLADEAAKDILCKGSKYAALGCIEFYQKNIFLSAMSGNFPFPILLCGQKPAIVLRLFSSEALRYFFKPLNFVQTKLSFWEKCLLFAN